MHLIFFVHQSWNKGITKGITESNTEKVKTYSHIGQKIRVQLQDKDCWCLSSFFYYFNNLKLLD